MVRFAQKTPIFKADIINQNKNSKNFACGACKTLENFGIFTCVTRKIDAGV